MRYRNINFNKGMMAVLALLAIYNIGVAPQNVLAYYDSGGDSGGGTTTPTPVEYKQPSVTITINNGQTIQAKTLQSVNGNYASGEISVPVTVKVENAGAYSIGAHTTNSNLVGKTNANNKIPSTTSAKTLAQLSNTWGFRVGSGTTYAAMPTTTNTTNIKARTALGKDAATTATENITLSFGTNINGDLPADTYTGTIVISALAELTTLANVTNMQDVAPEHCAATSAGDVFNLVDNRGPKYSYKVGKLADGKCWMLQNLALPGGTVLTSADSNVTSNYTLPTSNKTGWSSDTTAYVWDGTHINNTDDTAVTTAGTATTNTGAYYSFLAATAGTGNGSTQYSNATSSVCPKGWRLPTSYATGNSSADSGDFTILYKAYSSNQSQLQTALHRAATGFCNGGSCPDQNSYASSYYWSSTVPNGTYGHNLSMGTNGINPAHSYSKRDGYSVRCILGS